MKWTREESKFLLQSSACSRAGPGWSQTHCTWMDGDMEGSSNVLLTAHLSSTHVDVLRAFCPSRWVNDIYDLSVFGKVCDSDESRCGTVAQYSLHCRGKVMKKRNKNSKWFRKKMPKQREITNGEKQCRCIHSYTHIYQVIMSSLYPFYLWARLTLDWKSKWRSGWLPRHWVHIWEYLFENISVEHKWTFSGTISTTWMQIFIYYPHFLSVSVQNEKSLHPWIGLLSHQLGQSSEANCKGIKTDGHQSAMWNDRESLLLSLSSLRENRRLGWG